MLSSILMSIALQGAAPRAVTSAISEVTVFPSKALVQRKAELPAGAGEFVIAGLPLALEPDSVRARCNGARVVGLETRERFQPSVPSERVEELRTRARALERELAALRDEAAVLDQVGKHLGRLAAARSDDKEPRASNASAANAWRANLAYLDDQLAANRKAVRENGWKIEDAEQRLKDARLALDGADPSHGVRLRDVIIDVAGGDGAAQLELEYLVASAGWRPQYDLRTASNATSVDLSYRAQVWQQSGEDWNDVEVALSTAQPQLGAQGPDPRAIWLRIEEPVPTGGAVAPRELGYVSEERAKDIAAPASPAPRPFASVESQGLSVRFHLATRDTIPSRNEPSTVLIGQQTFAVAPEYYAAPALDSNVWLRGKAKNTSAWTLLAGRAAVYFGADFLGNAELELVQPGAEFELHLGPDPALTIERSQLEDLTSAPGLFGSKSAHKESFRVRLKNNGAAAARADGGALVFVREALARSTDDRIKIELAESKPALAQDERWTRDRDEHGVLTWPVLVPRGGEATLSYTTKISYPEGATVYQR